MKVYPNYKDSGVPWLGDVPEHWEIRKLKTVANVKTSGVDKHSHENEISVQLCNYTDVYKNDKITNAIKFMKATATEEEIHSFELVAGDVIITKDSETWDDIAVPSYVPNDLNNVICAYHLSLIRPFCSSYGPYLSFAFQVQPFANQFKVSANGVTRFGLSQNTIKNSFFFVPTQDEQLQISRYLDWQTAKINQFIKAKKKLIALLKEQKQNIAHHTITRGLDQNVELKPSGLEWLGDVPKHWDVIRVGNIINLTTGFPFPSAGFSQNKEDTKLLRGVNVTPSGIRWDSVVYWKRALDDGLDHFQLREGDIVLGMDRPIISSGVRASKISSNDTGALLLQRVARLRPNSNVIGDFLLLLISSQMFADYMAPIFTGVSVPHLSPDQICKYKVALPPVNEQKLIISHIEKETALIDKTIARTEREIELIQEYRTRLVSDVVTGKVDVRSVEIPDFEPVEADLEVQDDEESEDELITEGEE